MQSLSGMILILLIGGIDVYITDRIRVLKHHPDKRMGAGEQVNPECDYFACIVKAFETLTGKRQAYDSIDPDFDNYIPSKTLSPKDDFFTVRKETEVNVWFISYNFLRLFRFMVNGLN